MSGKTIKIARKLIKKWIINVSLPLFWKLDMVLIKPSFVSIAVEETCFFRCKYCEIWKLKKIKEKMTLNQYKLTLVKLAKWLDGGELSFSGGEPFLNPDFIQIVHEANKLGFKTFVNTNAFLLNKNILTKVIKAGISGISVSIDGLGKTHDWSRGKLGAFQKAESVIKLMKKLKMELKASFEIGMTTILMKTNMDQLDELIKWGKKVGLESISFQALNENIGVNNHSPDWYKESDFWPDSKQAKIAINHLIELKKKGGIIGNNVNELRDYYDYYANGPKKFGLNRKCYVGLRNFVIDVKGDVRLCYFFDPVGNILKDSPEKLWRGIQSKTQRRKIRECKRGCRVMLCNRRSRLGLREIIRVFRKEFRV